MSAPSVYCAPRPDLVVRGSGNLAFPLPKAHKGACGTDTRDRHEYATVDA